MKLWRCFIRVSLKTIMIIRMKLSILVWFLCFAVLTVCLLLYRVCLHAPQNVEMTLRQHVVQVLPYMLSDMWPLLIFVSSLTCLGTESLMVGVCSASNRHVLMDKTHPTEEGSVTLRRFFLQPGPGCSLHCALTCLLFVPPHRSVQSLPDKSKQEALRVDLVDAIRRKQNT